MSLRLYPVTLKEANEFVRLHHRHHKPVVGHKFSIGVADEEYIHGVIIVGRPVSRIADDGVTAEATRCCTDGTRHVASMLYAAAARCATAMGYTKIQTYILETELGTSLKAAGWEYSHSSGGGTWNRESGARTGRREDQPLSQKRCWTKELTR